MRRLALFSNFVYALLLIVLALVPRAPSLSGFGVSDFLAHAVAYGLQAGLLFWLFELNVRGGAALWAIFGASGLGVLTEMLQILSPVRHFEYQDMLADLLGAVFVVSLLFVARCLGKWRAL